jgi:hypothetical protein
MLNKNFILLIVGFLIVAFTFGWFQTGSFISIPSHPLEQKTFTFDGFSGQAESVVFGSVSSNRQGTSICQNTNGEVVFENDFLSTGGSMDFYSRAKTSPDASCGRDYNGVKATTQISKGVLTIDLNTVANTGVSAYHSGAVGSVEIKLDGVRAFYWETRVHRNTDFREDNEIRTIVINETSDIEVFVKTTIDNQDEGSDVKTNLKLTLEKENVQSTNVETQEMELNYSQTNLTFFEKINLWISNFFNRLFGGNQ